MNTTQQYCTFHVADLFFGVEVQVVQEVIRHLEMTSVPLAAREVGGLINLRGQIVTAIDMRRRLGLPELTTGERPMNVIIRTDDAAVSLLVDHIGDVLELGTDTFEPSPETLRGAARELIHGVHKLQGRLLLVLDVARAVTVAGNGENSLESDTRIAA